MPRLDRVAPLTDAEMDAALSKNREIVAYSAANRERYLFLKLAFRTGDIGVAYLDTIHADYLLRTLKKFLPNDGKNDGSPLKWAAEHLEDASGNLPTKS